MIAYVHTSLRVLEGWFCVVVLRACVRYSSRRCVPAWVCVRVVARVVACCVPACVLV